MSKHTVRLSHQPDREIEVEGPELLDLRRQGLVLEGREAEAPVERRAAARQSARAAREATAPSPNPAAEAETKS